MPCGVFRKCKWGTQGNGKLTAFASGRPAFQKHAKHAEGSDTTHASHTQKALSAGCTNRNFDKSEKITLPSGAATPRNSDTHHAHRCSAGSLRSLRAPPDQDPKAAKFAVLTPGPGMFVNVRNAPRVVIPPPSESPSVSPCKPLCAIFLEEPSVYPLLPVKANVGHL